MGRVSIEAKNLNKTIGHKTLLKDVSFSVNHGEKTALVGLNGCGKSTLIKILAGIDEEYAGNISIIPARAKVGYLPQWIEFEDVSVKSVLDKALDKALISEKWEREIAAGKVLEEVNLGRIPLNQSAARLSGGEKTRLCLACLLIEEPEFLLLDEPSNFLDIEGLRQIESFIRNSPCGILFVSHDRHLMDAAAGRVIELEEGKITEYSGNYSFYRSEKQAAREQLFEEYRIQQREIKRLKSLAAREKGFAKRAGKGPDPGKCVAVVDWGYIGAKAAKHDKKAKAIEKRIERMEKVELPKRNYMADIRFEGNATSRIVAKAENLVKSFGERTLYSNVDFTITAGEKTGILGPNGSGKTILLKILQGKEQPSSGSTFLLNDSRVGYFSQIFESLNPQLTAVTQIMESTGLNLWDARQTMASFLFFEDDVFKKVENLSIGEKSRLALACIKAANPEAIILDEPTNHLDVQTAEILENALREYPGTVIIVTHDRRLLDNLAEKLLIISGKKIINYPGKYSEWAEKNNFD
ncbi:MAG: ATP-binding cassette domain-containing protein [Firmicutes bacterium]|nr:ATP-binding cassette domain-containing protein [Bacillota bacterium]